MIRRDVARADLKNAWFRRPRVREDGAEVQVVSEDDSIVFACESHDFRIRAPGVAQRTPVRRFPSCRLQNFHPGWTEIHVHQNLHVPPALTATSSSSTRHAAYASASSIS